MLDSGKIHWQIIIYFFKGFTAIQWRIWTEDTFSQDSAQGPSVGLLFVVIWWKWKQNRMFRTRKILKQIIILFLNSLLPPDSESWPKIHLVKILLRVRASPYKNYLWFLGKNRNIIERRFTLTAPGRGAQAPNRAISNSCLWY